MPVAIAIAVGGAVGSWLRYVLATEVTQRTGLIGAGTFVVNVAGALALGLLVSVLETPFLDTPRWVASGLGIGLLGGFTTFSSYTLDAFHQIEDGSPFVAIAYLTGTAGVGLAAAFVGVWLGRQPG